MRVAVVGHVEWTEFVLVDEMPGPGEIATGLDFWAVPAGGGAVVAAQLAKLAGACELFTAFGDDEIGHGSFDYLRAIGITVCPEWFGQTRRAFTHVDRHGERTITTVGPKLRPHGPPSFAGYDAVFFVSGEVAALVRAREARFLAATPREIPTLLTGGVRLDLLVGSANDPGERYEGGLEVGIFCRTEGVHGGRVNGSRYQAVTPPGPIEDTYGAGDSFAAALCFALARGDSLADAVDLAARAGAAVVTGKGPFEAQISLQG